RCTHNTGYSSAPPYPPCRPIAAGELRAASGDFAAIADVKTGTRPDRIEAPPSLPPSFEATLPTLTVAYCTSLTALKLTIISVPLKDPPGHETCLHLFA